MSEQQLNPCGCGGAHDVCLGQRSMRPGFVCKVEGFAQLRTENEALRQRAEGAESNQQAAEMKLGVVCAELDSVRLEAAAAERRVEEMRKVLEGIAVGHWEAEVSNTWERSYNRQWGKFLDKATAMEAAKNERNTHGDTASMADAVYVTDLCGEEILQRAVAASAPPPTPDAEAGGQAGA